MEKTAIPLAWLQMISKCFPQLNISLNEDDLLLAIKSLNPPVCLLADVNNGFYDLRGEYTWERHLNYSETSYLYVVPRIAVFIKEIQITPDGSWILHFADPSADIKAILPRAAIDNNSNGCDQASLSSRLLCVGNAILLERVSLSCKLVSRLIIIQSRLLFM